MITTIITNESEIGDKELVDLFHSTNLNPESGMHYLCVWDTLGPMKIVHQCTKLLESSSWWCMNAIIHIGTMQEFTEEEQ